MRKSISVVAAATIGLFAAIAMTPSDAVAAGSFDGQWSVVIQTSQGKCGIYRAAVQITDGEVVSNPGDYAVSGNVSASGVTSVRVINEEGSATGTGRLHGATGSGTWQSSSGACAGTWTATRRP
jgi:hypothetical protein